MDDSKKNSDKKTKTGQVEEKIKLIEASLEEVDYYNQESMFEELKEAQIFGQFVST